MCSWDAGPVAVARTLSEGDTVAGFEVVHLPGHALGDPLTHDIADRLTAAADNRGER